MRWRPESSVRFGSKADMYSMRAYVRSTPESGHVQCTRPCLLWANSGHRNNYGRSGKQRSHARQNDPDFCELARPSVDLDRAAMPLHNDVVTDGEPEPGAFSSGFCGEERVEHLLFHFRW